MVESSSDNVTYSSCMDNWGPANSAPLCRDKSVSLFVDPTDLHHSKVQAMTKKKTTK